MASTDARPIAIKNTAYRVYFPLYDADGDLVSGASGLDSEVSKDGGNFSDCTNEATEIGSSGVYYLDLTSTEMNADAVVVIVKTSTTGAKTTVLVFYPQEAGDINVTVEAIANNAITASAIATDAITAAKIAADAIGSSELATTAVNEIRDAILSDSTAFAGASIAAIKAKTDNLPSDPADASDIAGAFSTVNSTLSTIAGYVDTEVAAIKAKTDNLPASPAATSDIPTANANADALLDRAAGVETSLTIRQAMRLMVAALLGKASGLATTTAVFRDTNDSRDRITATVDTNGNRSAVTLDAS